MMIGLFWEKLKNGFCIQAATSAALARWAHKTPVELFLSMPWGPKWRRCRGAARFAGMSGVHRWDYFLRVSNIRITVTFSVNHIRFPKSFNFCPLTAFGFDQNTFFNAHKDVLNETTIQSSPPTDPFLEGFLKHPNSFKKFLPSSLSLHQKTYQKQHPKLPLPSNKKDRLQLGLPSPPTTMICPPPLRGQPKKGSADFGESDFLKKNSGTSTCS